MLALLLCVAMMSACSADKSSPVAPSPEPDPPAPPPVTTFTVSGRVVEVAGAPLAGAHVDIARGEEPPLATETDVDGRYHIDNLTAGTYLLRASADGFAPSTVPLEVEADKAVDLTLTRAGAPDPPGSPDPPAPPDVRWSLAGTVRDAGSGAALPGAAIEVTEGPPGNIGRTASTAADGTFALAGLVPGSLTVRARGDGHMARSVPVALQADTTIDIALDAAPPPGPAVSGVVADVLTDHPLAGVTVRIEGGGETTSNDAGAFTLTGNAARNFQPVVLTSPDAVDRLTYLRAAGPTETVTLMPRSIDLHTFDEMLRTRGGLLRWTMAPRLVIERRVLTFTNTTDASYVAGADVMDEGEAADLVADLQWALPQLTGGMFTGFAGVDVELADEGASIPVSRPGIIIVARYAGLREALSVLGYGRWAWNASGEVRAGALMLDAAFDRSTDPYRRALRAHELGHTLGYDHVSLDVSVMHPSARTEPTSFDREATKIAFRRPPMNTSPDIDPDPDASRPASTHLTWTGAP